MSYYNARKPSHRRTVTIGIADLFSPSPASAVRMLFGTALRRAAARIGCDLDIRSFGIDAKAAGICGTGWPLLRDLDGLIVTGTEPSCDDIADEPILSVIARLLGTGPASTVFSCQSAHSALYLLHGIKRRRLPAKRTGVFPHQLMPAGIRLSQGLPRTVTAPHSRWNTVPVADLRRNSVLPVLADDDEWQLAVSSDGLRHVFLQGHPEYLPDTLLREYRRDLHRFRAGTLPIPPAIPSGYLPPAAESRLRAASDPARQDDAIAAASQVLARDCAQSPWIEPCDLFFANWLRSVRETRSSRPFYFSTGSKNVRADLELA